MYLTLQRYLMISLAGLLLTLFAIYSVRYFQQPDIYPGDQLVERTCRWCGGSGEDKDLAMQVPELGDACRACRGDGRVDVIIPGAERPTKLAGVAADRSWASETATADDFRAPPAFGGDAERHRAESHTLMGVQIRIRKANGDVEEITSNEFGFFNTKLAPGRYILTARADGFETLTYEFEVQHLTEPIWLEEANLLIEPESEAQARSRYGLNLLVALATNGAGPGVVRFSSGTP